MNNYVCLYTFHSIPQNANLFFYTSPKEKILEYTAHITVI